MRNNGVTTSTQIPNKAADTTTNAMEITYIEDETGEDDRDEKKEGSKDKKMGTQHEGADEKKKNDRSYIDAIKERLIPVAS
eukprot:2603998-Ditylum_brightwellii.AAC.1